MGEPWLGKRLAGKHRRYQDKYEKYEKGVIQASREAW
jgi:hypothetical protein